MKNTKYIITLVLAAFSCYVQAQISGLDYKMLNASSNRMEGKLKGDVYYISAEANSYHFLTGWSIGKIFLEDNDIFEDAELRFLISENELIFYNKRLRSLYKIDKEIVYKFMLNDRGQTRIFEKLYFDGMNSGQRFFEILYQGEKTLLANHSIDEIKVRPYNDSNGVLRDTEFRKKTTYYLFSEDSAFEKITPKRRSFYRLFAKQKKEIRKIFRRNGISFQSQNDLIQAVALLENNGIL